MTIEDAIKKAIEGGYRMRFLSLAGYKANRDEAPYIKIDNNYYLTADLFLDPLFWSSLGNAIGWKLKKDLFQTHDTVFVDSKSNYIDEWLYQWYKFVNTLAKGKTAEDYFKSLN